MKHIHLLAGVVAAVVLAACGGSNSSSSSSSPVSSSGSTASGLHIECVVLNPTTYDVAPNGQKFVIQDPNDIEALDQVQFQLVYYDASGNRVVIPTSQWTTNDTSNTFGQISYNSGIFIASKAQTSTPEIVSVVYQDRIYSTNYSVNPHQVRLRGIVLDDVTHQPVPRGTEIDFYGPQNPTVLGSPLVFVGSVTTAYDGTFRASVPDSVSGFTFLNKSIPAAYERFFRFQGSYYDTGDTTCLAPLPTYTNGEYFVVDYTNSDVTSNGSILLAETKEGLLTTACGTAAAASRK